MSLAFGAVMSAFAALLGAGLSASYNERSTARQEAREDTAYQRSTQDMIAAGLNPAMMYGSGSAASSSASLGSTDIGSNSNTAAQIASGLRMQDKEIDKLESDIDVNRSTDSLNESQVLVNDAQGSYYDALARKTDAETNEINIRAGSGLYGAQAEEYTTRSGLNTAKSKESESQVSLNSQFLEESRKRMEQISSEIGLNDARINKINQDAKLEAERFPYEVSQINSNINKIVQDIQTGKIEQDRLKKLSEQIDVQIKTGELNYEFLKEQGVTDGVQRSADNLFSSILSGLSIIAAAILR